MKESTFVFLFAGGMLVFGLIGSIIIGSIYMTLAAVGGLSLLPVWALILRRIERWKPSKKKHE